MAFLSDNESDSYSLLEAPRPSTQALMMEAVTQEGRLTELVLGGQVELSRSIALCLELLGLGTTPPERQSATARALVSLVTHRKLRPAVDNLLVMRRLCRIIELTDSATALAEAGVALFKVADDAAWKTKGGSTVEILREAVIRCVGTIRTVAQATAAMQDYSVGTPKTSTSPETMMPLPMDSATVDEDQAALVAAAAAVLRAPVLHLLSPDDLVEASRALASCIASGFGCGEVLSALSAVVQHGPARIKDRADRALAAVGCRGMVTALLKAVANGLQRGSIAGGGDGSSGSKGDGKGVSASAGAVSGKHAAVELSTAARNAFSCLREVLVACTVGCPPSVAAVSSSIGTLLDVAVDDVTSALLPLLQQFAPEGHPRQSQTLQLLLLLSSLTSSPTSSGGLDVTTVAAAVAPDGPWHAASGAVLTAAECLLKAAGDEVASDFSDGSCAATLLRLAAAMLENGTITVEQLQQQAPGLVQAMVGVISGKKPEPAWGGLLITSVACPAFGSADAENRYPDTLRSAAAQLMCPLLEASAAVQDHATPVQPWITWLQPDVVASALLGEMVTAIRNGTSGVVSGQLGGCWGRRCLMLSLLQLPEPATIWKKYDTSDLQRLIMALAADLRQGDTDKHDQLPQLAAVMALSMWWWYAAFAGPGLLNTDPLKLFARELLVLDTTALRFAISAASSSQESKQRHLADVAGVLNAVVGCLQPQLALAGAQCLPLSPALPSALLSAQLTTVDKTGRSQTNLLELHYVCNKSDDSSHRYHSKASDFSMQLKWNFESSHHYDVYYDEGCTTVASTTAEPLLRELGAAACLLSELVEAQLPQPSSAAGGSEPERALGPKAAAVVRAAVRVAGNTAKVLARCIPPGKVDCTS